MALWEAGRVVPLEQKQVLHRFYFFKLMFPLDTLLPTSPPPLPSFIVYVHWSCYMHLSCFRGFYRIHSHGSIEAQ